MKPKILIIDDEAAICVSLKYSLCSEYDITTATSRQEALYILSRETFQLILLDIYLGNDDGLSLMQEIREQDPDVVIIIMTAHGSIRSSVAAVRAGAFTYLTKPLDIEELKLFVQQGLHYRTLNQKIAYLSGELQRQYQYGEMIGKSPVMQQLYSMVERLKNVDTPVVISGESGTGKELVARAIHFMGNRKNESFVAVDCAAIPEGVLELEFYGYSKDSFDRANADKVGKFEVAHKGTLFLDEIGDMPLSLQGKLLRVLQEKRFTPIGSNESRPIDVRIIAATNKDLRQMVQNGTFRQELYYRLNVANIQLPTLQERKQDIPLLIAQFICQTNKERERQIKGVTKEVERLLMAHDYPGNVRELKNIIEFASIMCDQEYIRVEDLPAHYLPAEKATEILTPPLLVKPFTLYEIEKRAIMQALSRNNGHQRKTAEELGISERGLHNKLKEYGYKK